MKKIFTLVLGLLSLTLFSQINSFAWAKQLGGTQQETGNSVAVDLSGNVYTSGSFYGTADFDTGSGVFNLTSAGTSDIFISKLDAAGNFVWAKKMGGSGDDDGLSIAIDAVGNIYVGGKFKGTADFDPGVGVFNLISAGAEEIFISKLDKNGNFVWAKRIGSYSADVASSIALDKSGNVYATGYFEGTVDFDPGAGTHNLTAPSCWSDAFILKLNTSGNFVWVKKFEGTLTEFGNSIAIDALGNVYTTGIFHGTTDFDPGVGTYNLTSNQYATFISKLDAAGNFVWANQVGGNSSSAQARSIVVDALGNVYTTGHFNGTVYFGTFSLSCNSWTDMFISKLDKYGNFRWAKKIGGGSESNGSSVTIDRQGSVYTTGYFEGTVDFDPGIGTFNLTSAGAYDILISKLDSLGNFVWAKNMGGIYSDNGQSIAIDLQGNIYNTGFFAGTADFDPSQAGGLICEGWLEAFVCKHSNPTNWPTVTSSVVNETDPKESINNTLVHQSVSTRIGISDVKVYPNPNNGSFCIESNVLFQMEIMNVLGQEILNETITIGKQNIDIQDQAKGIYFIKILEQDKQQIVKLIKQ
jgi:hypothetical protein